ncbi:hypothetical protein K438DRAFT_1755162 [Mycena galopus ATCC 62051]|nr:hypothetical protein K438DRAFT_1755162 [Mycena galopus ATCC 62051]
MPCKGLSGFEKRKGRSFPRVAPDRCSGSCYNGSKSSQTPPGTQYMSHIAFHGSKHVLNIVLAYFKIYYEKIFKPSVGTPPPTPYPKFESRQPLDALHKFAFAGSLTSIFKSWEGMRSVAEGLHQFLRRGDGLTVARVRRRRRCREHWVGVGSKSRLWEITGTSDREEVLPNADAIPSIQANKIWKGG